MSELTLCNRCTLRGLEQHAANIGWALHLLPSLSNPLGGTDVLIVPPDEQVDRELHWVAWLWVISEQCAC